MDSTARKERLPELDLFRAFAILGVIHVHASSYAAGIQASASPYYYFFNWMNIFFKFGTPCFIFLSSFVLFYNYAGRPVDRGLIARFYKKRLLFIVFPYLVASVCYYIVSQTVNGRLGLSFGEHMAKLGVALATGTAYTHLYFVFINVQFYALFPLALLLLQRYRRLAAWAVPIGLTVEWGFALWNKYDLLLANKASYAPTYMSYYMLGMCLAVYFDSIKDWLGKTVKLRTRLQRWGSGALWGSWLTVAMLHVQAYHNGRAYGQWLPSLAYELLWNIHSLLSAFVLLQAAFWVYRKGGPALVSFLARMGALSFAIYLLHPVFLLVYRRFRYTIAPESAGYVVWIWAGVPVCLLLAWLTAVSVYRWVPGAALLLGSKPAGVSGRASALEPARAEGADRSAAN
jgi:peptidoglycan/LPS O-acetylase OafA/YrhL